MSLTLIVRIGAAILCSSTRSVGASEIRRQLRVVMTFPLPIFPIKDGLKLANLGGNIPDEGPLSEPESDSTFSSTTRTYGDNEVQSMLGFLVEDALVEIAWPAIQKKALDVESAQTLQLKLSLAVAMQSLDPLFLDRYDLESIKAPVIASNGES